MIGPRSLLARMLILLVAGLLVAQGITVWLMLSDRNRSLHHALAVTSAQSVAAVVRLAEGLPEAERRDLVDAFDLPLHRLSLDEPWAPAPEGSTGFRARLFSSMIARMLPENHRVHVQALELDPRQQRARAAHPAAGRGERHLRWQQETSERRVRLPPRLAAMRIQVALPDGTVLTFHQALPEEALAQPVRLLAAVAVLLLSVLVLSVIAARQLVGPLRQLADAATRLGRDIRSAPVPEQGALEVRQAARAFNTMQRRLQRYIEDRGRILTAVSHDLKTPITRMRLRTELLDDEALGNRFRRDLDDMEAMVTATLEFMRGTEDPEPVAAVDMEALADSLGEDVREAGFAFARSGSAPRPYPGRPLALKRCLGNLLDNAMHHGAGPVEVALADSPGKLLIRVLDRGPGIPEAELERVCEPFHRLESSRSRNTGGTGLGLGIARNIARAHGGDLTLHNRCGGGLEARLELPREPS